MDLSRLELWHCRGGGRGRGWGGSEQKKKWAECPEAELRALRPAPVFYRRRTMAAACETAPCDITHTAVLFCVCGRVVLLLAGRAPLLTGATVSFGPLSPEKSGFASQNT